MIIVSVKDTRSATASVKRKKVNDFEGYHDIWIRESNLIEGVDDEQADKDSHEAFKKFYERKLTRESILHLHYDVMLHQNRRIAGSYRRMNVAVGNHTAPHWKIVPNLLKDWLANWGDIKDQQEIIIGHILFEKIHPFEDGNGRVGRMIINYQTLKAGQNIVCFYSASKRKDYYPLFDEFDRIFGHDWTRKLRRRNGTG